ncbi:MAG: hypothetical protein EP346_12115 [Bacteroidetes bacterium]|nr:MAG: hypothetical protein EP346_12115 [Bacteroidota bacterium]
MIFRSGWRVAPWHNRADIFYTDENSPHGYSNIDIPKGEARKSFYSYFYTELGERFKYSVSRLDDNAIKRQHES